MMNIVPEIDLPEAFIIKRDDLPSIHSVIEDGKEYHLGIVKNLRENDELKNFIPENLKLSMSWVRLKNNETLEVHQHPIKSMIIICKGSVVFTDGYRKLCLEEGDIVAVPSQALHGFISQDVEGFWGISVQFECHGLYEDVKNPLVSFVQNTSQIEQNFLELKKRNEVYKRQFSESRIFQLVRKGYFQEDAKKEMFLDYFQIWSDHFQKMMTLRVALCNEPKFLEYFQEHFNEEFAHNTMLKKSRTNFQRRWDPVLESLGALFVNKMATEDNLSKLLIVNFVIEESATVFYANFLSLFREKSKEHFETHNELDHDHAEMGIEEFKNLTSDKYQELYKIQHESWLALIALFDRIADLLQQDE